MNSIEILQSQRQFAKAIADDTRYDIMLHLCCVWCSVSEVAEKMEGKVNQPTVSHHLKVLEEANLVLVRQEGRQRFYTLNRDHITVCCNQLQHVLAPETADAVVPIARIQIVNS